MGSQEPQAERRQIDLPYRASGNKWSSDGSPHGYMQPQSSLSDFAGTGVSNNNGSFSVGGNLYLNHGNTADKEITPTLKRSELLNSLRFEQIESRQLSIKKAHENTCRWFLTAPAYTQWEEKASSQTMGNLLWIKGKPGAGKSTLMNYLDKQLRSRLRKKEGPCSFISFFFNARGSALERSIEGMYRSLLVQLLEARPELQHVLDGLRSVPKWDVSLLQHLFEQTAEESTTIICLIDALDECQEDDIRDVVKSFESMLRAGSQLHVCFASRHYPHISTQMGSNITLEEQAQHKNDISSYLDTKLDIGHSKQAEEIRLELREKASGVFMWVVLVVEMLNKEYDKGKIPNLRKRLRQLPSDLHELFHSILVRDNEDRDELLLCIQWVLFAKGPLTLKELYFAIISGSDPESLLDYHSSDISENDMQRYILNSSKGLTELTKSFTTPTVQFIHESVRDFLLKGDGLHRVFPNLSVNIFGSSHESLRTCCLKYIEMDKQPYLGLNKSAISPSPTAYTATARPPRAATYSGVLNSSVEDWRSSGSSLWLRNPSDEQILTHRAPRRTISRTPLEFPFLDYAIKGILHHANEAASNGLNQKDFLTEFPRVTWVENYNIQQGRRRYSSQVSMLHILAEAGTTLLIDVLPNIQSCFDVEETCFGLPIVCAWALNHFDCAQEMLRVQAKRVPGFCFEEFLKTWSPILAISNGSNQYDDHRCFFFNRNNPKIVELSRHGGELASIFYLATEDIDVNAKDIDGFTSTMVAAHRSYCYLLDELCQRGADLATALPDGRTALHLAAQGRRPAAAVKQLIDLGADVSVVDKNNCTAFDILRSTLICRPRNEPCNIIRLLIDNGVQVSSTDSQGRTLLHLASQLQDGGELVRLLLDLGANIAATDNEGLTPIHYWSRGGTRSKSVELATRLKKWHWERDEWPAPEDSATPEQPATHEYLDMGKLLLSRGADVAAIDKDGKTPLHHCWSRETSELLLNHNACISAVDASGNTPLHTAAEEGAAHKYLCQLLLHRGADPEALNTSGQIPFDVIPSYSYKYSCTSLEEWVERNDGVHLSRF